MAKLPKRIRIRVAGVVVRDGHVLLVKHRKNDEEYWLLPGGGVDPGEALGNALAREFWEELRVQARAGAILCINDSIPPDGSRHIVNIYMQTTINSGEPQLGEDPRVVEVAWHPVDSLNNLPIFPAIAEKLIPLLKNETQGAPYLGAYWKEV